MEDRKLTTAQSARRAGVKPSTWRAWRSHGRPRPIPAPQPDGWDGGREYPCWWQSTIDTWLQGRGMTPQEPP